MRGWASELPYIICAGLIFASAVNELVYVAPVTIGQLNGVVPLLARAFAAIVGEHCAEARVLGVQTEQQAAKVWVDGSGALCWLFRSWLSRSDLPTFHQMPLPTASQNQT